MNLEAQVLEALRREVAVASVSPVMTVALEASGIGVDMVPTHPKMGALVKSAAELALEVLSTKRSVLKNNRNQVYPGPQICLNMPGPGRSGTFCAAPERRGS